MKIFKLLLFSGILFSVAATTNKRLLHDKTSATTGFTVVELFTSEGCSSCPPADALIEKIQKETIGQPVYILAYHVDYWDRLGWKDPFSSHAFSARQYQYSSWLKLNGVYTPQAVVNGQKEFIGSQEGTMHNAIKSGLQNDSSAQLQLTAFKATSSRINVHYNVTAPANSDDLVLVAVQQRATTQVSAGENKGRTLSHVQIVRALKQYDIKRRSDGDVTLEVPAGTKADDFELIGLLQNTNSGRITAATKTGRIAQQAPGANMN